jgi:FMN phosphatase YigB (HAD superfamily)
MIKAVIFDVGGVLVRTEDQLPRRQLEAQYGLQPGEAEFLVYNSDMGQQSAARRNHRGGVVGLDSGAL